MKPRYTHLLMASIALIALGGGVAVLRYLPDAESFRAALRRAGPAAPPSAGTLAGGLRGGSAPSAESQPTPETVKLAGPVHVVARPIPGAPVRASAPPDARDASAIAALEALPSVSAFPPSLLEGGAPAPATSAPAEDASAVEGAVSLNAPLPPARPADLARVEAAAAPTPPHRPSDLASRVPVTGPKPAPAPLEPKPQPLEAAAAPASETAAPAVAPPAQQPAAVLSDPSAPTRTRDAAQIAPARRGASAPGESARQQVARLSEPTLRPAPDDAFQQEPLRFGMGSQVFIRIFKQEGHLELYLRKGARYALYKSYPICKWSGHLGPKVREADFQSPEGFYSVSARQLHPHSNYHRAFNVGYPNAYDRQNGRTGGLVMVHGNCKSVGCFAMTDAGIEEIYGFVDAALRAGQREIPVHIFPFHMTDHAISRETGGGWMAFAGGGNGAQWANFWRNLKEGYDLFEQTGEPPVAFACGDHYAFGAAGGACPRVAGW